MTSITAAHTNTSMLGFMTKMTKISFTTVLWENILERRNFGCFKRNILSSNINELIHNNNCYDQCFTKFVNQT